MRGDGVAKAGDTLGPIETAPVTDGNGLVAKYQQTHWALNEIESLVRLTGGVAHEFSNLLMVVIGNATALRLDAEARGDIKGVRRAEIIERSAERGGRLASQLLAFARNQVLRPESISAYSALSAMHELLGQAAGDSVRIRLVADKDLWDCRVDPGQLDSAILNLVLNSRDAMPNGGDITISCHNHRENLEQIRKTAGTSGDYVRIDVKDSGTGIPPDLARQGL